MAGSDDRKPSDEAKAEPVKKSEARKRKVEPKFDAKPDASAEAAFDAGSEPPFEAKAEPSFDAKSEPAFEGDAKADPTFNEGAEPKPDPKFEASTSAPRAKRNDADAGKALAPSGPMPIDPFLAAKAKEKVETAPPPRSFASRMLDYSAHAAIIVGLIGFAWTVSGYVINRPKTETQATTAKASPGKLDEMGELRLANIKMHEELKALKSSVDALRTASRRDTTPEQVRMLSAGLDNIKSSVAAARSETSASIAQLQSKVDKLAPGKMQALADRVGRLEHQSIDPSSTASIARSEPQRPSSSRSESARTDSSRTDTSRTDPSRTDTAKPAFAESAKTPPKPPAKPAELANLESKEASAPDDKPTIIQGWVVRDVYQGVALVEGKRGQIEVVPGVSIPGAGVVKSIERKGGGWVVTTSKGQLAYAGAAAQREQRDNRRGGGYGYGGGGGYNGGYGGGYGRYPYRDY